MPIIKTIAPEDATGKLAEIYDGYKKVLGFVPNAFQLGSTSEFMMEMQAKYLAHYMGHPVLNPNFQAFLRMLVSIKQECAFCINMNTGMLLNSGFTMEQIEAAKANPETMPLSEKEKALVLFVLKIINNSNSTEEGDMIKLRDLGWQDSEIIEAVFAGTNQVASDMMFNAFKIED